MDGGNIVPTFWKGKHNKVKITTADKWFSICVRLDAIIEESHGFARCSTCKKPVFWRDGDCGHYATRDHPMTRFNEQNSHFQCHSCNRFKKGEQGKHGIEIDKLYGGGTAQRLIELSEIGGQKIHTKLALKDISKEYRLKAKKIAKEKGIEL